MTGTTPHQDLPRGLPPQVGRVTVYRRSRRGWIAVIGVALIPLIAIFFLRDPYTLACELPALLAFVGFCLVFPLVDNWVMVVADDEGIAARDWGWLKIKWADIDNVRVYSRWLSGPVLALDLRNPEEYVARMSKTGQWSRPLNQRFTGALFTFNPTGLTASSDQIVAKIRRHAFPFR